MPNETLYPHEQIVKWIKDEFYTPPSFWIVVLALAYSIFTLELMSLFVWWYIPLYFTTLKLSWPPMYLTPICYALELACWLEYALLMFAWLSLIGCSVYRSNTK